MSDLQQMDWASFRVANEGQYGGGSQLEHHRERCDWSANIDDLNPLDISELASTHAAVCTGEPTPPPAPAQKSLMAVELQELWGKEIAASLQRSPLLTPVSGPGTGAHGA